MALCASGEMSLAGSVVGRSVACELGCSGTGEISMDRADVRALAGRPGAGCAICMCDFYGKSSGPPALGGAYEGGYYMGSVSSPANYYIIMAPNATGCACCQWRTLNTASPNTTSCTDGYLNTYTGLNSAVHPAGNWTATRSINGFSDWYLPARDELLLLYSNCISSPAGEGFVAAVFNPYWSSTQVNNSTACAIYMTDGSTTNGSKRYSFFRLRAIRRESF